ncbi:hypothetical protein TPA0910_83000 [Streptomyces hygroscopicus subsp. sporocinereus]|uniref:Uncharacterized protein n=1 Tax=Streptomyces hygroscopicus TaxID=1912 RepID=A0ABQ3UE89_STRHY|nr:hypothetical protein TPA0910_83000 [Streptomyces hygroscopicus]
MACLLDGPMTYRLQRVVAAGLGRGAIRSVRRATRPRRGSPGAGGSGAWCGRAQRKAESGKRSVEWRDDAPAADQRPPRRTSAALAGPGPRTALATVASALAIVVPAGGGLAAFGFGPAGGPPWPPSPLPWAPSSPLVIVLAAVVAAGRRPAAERAGPACLPVPPRCPSASASAIADVSHPGAGRPVKPR